MLTPTLLFTGLIVVLLALYTAHEGPAARNPATWLAGYALVIGLLAGQGVFLDSSRLPPPILFAVIGGLVWIGLALRYGRVKPSPVGLRALLAVSLARLPVEWMLHRLAAQGLIPDMMTWTGTNFDILSGLGAAALLAVSYARPLPPLALQIWNVAGLLLLLNVVVTALLSAPSPLQQLNFDQPNLAILQSPYTLLPAAIVPAVLYTHLRFFGIGRK